jgi:hypothetical protein
MPYNEKTTMKPDGSKTVRKEHIDSTTGKCFKIEITEYPSPQPDFSVMSHINKKPKTTVIYPEDTSEQDTGFHDTLMPVIGKTTVGKTTVKTVETKLVPKPTTAPIKVDVPTISKAPLAEQTVPTTGNTTNSNDDAGAGTSTLVPSQQGPQVLASTPKTAGEGGCCVVS